MRNRKKRSERNTLILAGLSLFSGVIAAMLGYAYIEKRVNDQHTSQTVKQVPLSAAPEMRTVVIVTHDISRGDLIKANELAVVQVPSASFNSPGALNTPKQAIGRIALQNLYTGEWLIERKVADGSNSGDPWNSLLGPGMRALRVPVDQVTGMLGLIQPGDRVDLIAVFPGTDGKTVMSKVLEQNVSVLAVGQQRLPREDDGTANDMGTRTTSVTLEVNQEQAERIALALELGKVRLALRNSNDTKISSSDGTRLRELMRSAKTHAPARLSHHRVQLLNGDTVSVKEVGR